MVEIGKQFKVSGVAIREGISRNKIKYRAEELIKFAPTLIGRPILKDHKSETDNVIGVVEKSSTLDNGKIVVWEGWIKEDGTGLIDKMNDGRIKEVSISGMAGKVVKETEDSDIMVVKDVEAMELSTTPTPGVKGTSLQLQHSVLDLSNEGIKKMIENYEAMSPDMQKCPECDKMIAKDKMKQHTANNHTSHSQSSEVKMKGGKKMESENIQNKNDNNALILEEKAKLEIALKAAESKFVASEEARKVEAIARYNEKCKSKSINAKDLSTASFETIKALTEMVDEIAMPKAEAKVEEKVEVKEKAQVKTKEITPIVNEAYKDYVFDTTESQIAFYKWY